MKKMFEEPNVEVIEFLIDDVITTSGLGGFENDEPGDYEEGL